jgi:hypothetical protein
MCANFEAFAAVMFQIEIFRVVMPCSVVVLYRRFRGPFCLHLQGEVAGMGGNGVDIVEDWIRAACTTSQ